MKHDVVVIGSGLGGLECACILALAGKQVLVLERAMQPGGCMQSYRRRGMAYDTGLHYVGALDKGQSLHNVFKYLGLLDLPWHRLDTHYDHIMIGDRDFTFAQGYDNFVDTLARQFPAERRALVDYARLLRMCEQVQFDVINPDACTSLFDTGLFDRSAYQYLTENFNNPLLINVLSGAAMKMELNVDTMPLFNFLHCSSGFIESSWRLKVDGQVLVDALVRRLSSAGGRVQCGACVTQLVEENGKIARAVCSNGEAYEADCFISDVHPAVTCEMVRNSTRIKRMYRRRIESMPNTFGMFTVSLRLKPGVLPYFNYNQYIYREPNVWTFLDRRDGPLGGVMVSCRVPEQGQWAEQVDLLTPMLWSECQPYMCCDDHGQPVAHGRLPQYHDMKQSKAQECIKLAERFIPGLGNMVDQVYTSTPLTYHDYLGAPQGTAFGMRKDYHNALMSFMSPHTPEPNLLLTGQSLMLPGVQGVTVTSLITCAALLGKERIWNIVDR